MKEKREHASPKKEKKWTQEDIMSLLDSLYEKSIQGLPMVSPTVDMLAHDYLLRHKDVESAAKALINNQIAKCTTSGFLAGLGGLITLPVSVPANVSSVLYVQMRMIACLAQMGGFDTNSDQVQTLVYACLAGVSVDQVIKNVGIQFGTKLTTSMVKKIPGTALTKINQKVGFRFLTKFGEKGLINLGKAIPIVGGVIGGGFDFAETKIIANRAYKMFIEKGDSGLSPSHTAADALSDDAPSEIGVFCDWHCDNCKTYMNHQPGFTVESGWWTCTECGCINDVSENNILTMSEGIYEYLLEAGHTLWFIYENHECGVTSFLDDDDMLTYILYEKQPSGIRELEISDFYEMLKHPFWNGKCILEIAEEIDLQERSSTP